MDSNLTKRVEALELELSSLKASVRSTSAPAPSSAPLIHRAGRFVLTYWPLLSFLGAIAIVLYVRIVYGVDYFEGYQKLQAQRTLSAFYTNLGDDLIRRQEWVAAEDAYRQAIALDEHNTQATYGITKAQVMQPTKGDRYTALEVVDTRLDYLLKHFPEDPDLHLLKSVYLYSLGDIEGAIKESEDAIALDADCAGCFVNRGYLHQVQQDLTGAIENYTKALEIDPENFTASNNLGFTYILRGEFQLAADHLSRSIALSRRALTALNLADAYQYLGKPFQSLSLRRWAIRELNDVGQQEDRVVSGEWLYNFHPLKRGDVQTISQYVQVSSAQQKRCFAQYGLSFDHALAGDFDSAEKAFEAAQALDSDKEFSLYFAARVQSLMNIAQMDQATQDWFNSHYTTLWEDIEPKSEAPAMLKN